MKTPITACHDDDEEYLREVAESIASLDRGEGIDLEEVLEKAEAIIAAAISQKTGDFTA